MTTHMPEEMPHPRAMAYLGDAVFELHIRKIAIASGIEKTEALHRYTTDRVNANFQAELLASLEPHLTEAELEWVRRGRNLPGRNSASTDQATYRKATAFETLIGQLYLSDKSRFQEVMILLEPRIKAS